MPSKKLNLQLYADECFPVVSVTYLKSLGYSIVHAYDRKIVQKPDFVHLKESKKLNRVLITSDRDFLYYNDVNLASHPGVIVISVGTATPPHISKVCEKLLKNVSVNFIKGSLIKVTTDKVTKIKGGKVVLERRI